MDKATARHILEDHFGITLPPEKQEPKRYTVEPVFDCIWAVHDAGRRLCEVEDKKDAELIAEALNQFETRAKNR